MLLDHTYDISHQEIISDGHSRFEAIAPDGQPRLIDWYSLRNHDEELKFARYRQILRKLKQARLAQVDKIVSRPGTHYVVWFPAPEGLSRPHPKQRLAFDDELEALGITPEGLDPYLARGEVQLFHVPFDETAMPATAITVPLPSELESKVDTDTPPPQRRPYSFAWLGYWLPGVILMLMSVLLIAVTFRQMDQLIFVPDKLIGQDINDVSERLIADGFSVKRQALSNYQYDQTRLGEVIDVIPAEGSQLRRGHSVTLRYLATQSLVPQVTGYSLTEALNLLESSNIQLGSIAKIYSSASKDTVLAQTPLAMTPLQDEDDLILLVSLGPSPELSYLPDLVGLTAADAIRLAADAGVTIRSQDVDADALVQAQSIPPYHPFNPNEVVLRLDLTEAEAVLTELDQLTPNLLGMSEAEARQHAEQHGFGISEVSYVESPNLVSGVVQQFPVPASPRSEALRLTINRFVVSENTDLPLEPGDDIATDTTEPSEVSEDTDELRRYEVAWTIQPGIGQLEAEIIATTADGQDVTVISQMVQGGDVLRYEWQASVAYPVSFRLFLAGNVYGEAIVREGQAIR